MRLLVNPYGVIDRPGLAEAVSEWVKGGGWFVASPLTGHYDARGYTSPRVPPDAWQELLGIEQTELCYPTSATPEIKLFPVHLVESDLTAGIGSLDATRLVEAYALADSTMPLAVHNQAVIAAGPSLGAGRAIVCGTFLGAAFEYAARQITASPSRAAG